ncbi:GNAT family N-acetyltransferase [Klugiella xanthotipulae]|nr:GNAT family protein [Klugiella xanthotipulae]
MSFLAPATLTGPRITLEPLSPRHRDDLAEAVAEGRLWDTWYTSIPSPEGMADEIDRRLALRAEGQMMPWAVIDTLSGRAVGMTSFYNPQEQHRRVEVGYTWLGKAAQGVGINPEAKLLILTHAFETCGALSVVLMTHWHNHQSRAAIARLGAKQDGVLRNHQVWRDGTLRDTVLFSIISSEWPAVKSGLRARLRG